MFRSSLVSFFLFMGLMGSAAAQADRKLLNEHFDYICDLKIGMTPEQVLATMKRPPDVGEVQGDDIVSGWQMPRGDFVSVRFHKKQFISYLTLDYHPAVRRRDLWLPSGFEHTQFTITHQANVPGTQFEYFMGETQNGERSVWYRQQKDPKGYDIEIGFLSASRLKVGERDYQNDVTSKYIGIRKGDLPKFEKAMLASSSPATPSSAQANSEKKKE